MRTFTRRLVIGFMQMLVTCAVFFVVTYIAIAHYVVLHW